VIVATCDREILNLVHSCGGLAVIRSDRHVRCTDRVAEVMESKNADVVIDVQGDDPLVHPGMFGLILDPLKNEKDLLCTNLMNEIVSDIELNNPNLVKTDLCP